jgi:hypothetical protein
MAWHCAECGKDIGSSQIALTGLVASGVTDDRASIVMNTKTRHHIEEPL